MKKEEIKKENDELCYKYGIEDPCPSFGVGYSEGDSCCTHCWEDCRNYHDSCKELTTGKEVKTEVKKEVKKVKETVKSKTVKKEEKKMENKKIKANGTKKVEEKKDEKHPSNKFLIYQDWKKGVSVDTLIKSFNGRIKESTIKGWTKAWTNGKRLPAGV